MEQIRLRTSLKCGGCLAKVTPALNQLEGLGKWSVDLEHTDRILTAEISGISAGEVVAVIRGAGFVAEIAE